MALGLAKRSHKIGLPLATTSERRRPEALRPQRPNASSKRGDGTEEAQSHGPSATCAGRRTKARIGEEGVHRGAQLPVCVLHRGSRSPVATAGNRREGVSRGARLVVSDVPVRWALDAHEHHGVEVH